ncbi:c-type cytochrome [Thioalkalivibrio paradoxus]|uniref:Cytochrome C n=1 Tax=Thioalkalivibrio paradoxus ARh 1 TaxID=713585 RepID=W0DMR6_9GAMM|nr:c-type cytochrome [Thioalkalivibrio paradoxus]AHE99736.1 cytochrome C [Thioalkalivibrio paradoxus ARh 1]
MNYMRASLPMVLSLALLLPLPAQAGDPARGQELSQACAACHGADGNSVNPEWPKIAGQHADYIHKQLMDYKSGRREDALMAGQVANLDEQDMRDLAAFYARQEMSTGTADETVAERGERIYRGGIPTAGVAACSACHGASGKGNPAAMFPRVAGQHAQYNADQVHAFRSGARANDNGRMMRNLAARMSDEDIRAVAEYMAGLRAQ